MSSPDPRSPDASLTPDAPPTSDAPPTPGPTTQEIPVATPAAAQPLPPHPGAAPPAPVQAMRSTGPVDFVPGPPVPPPPPIAAAPAPEPTPPAPVAQQGSGATSVWPESLETGPVGTGPVETPPPATAPGPRDRRSLLGAGLVVVALVLLELGLILRFGGESFWSEIPLWSAFATACTALGLAGFAALVPGGRRLGGETGWRVAAGGLVGLAVFWLLVVLPVVASDRGFLLTAAVGCLGAALWTGPARRS